jgi:hypothetical protein
MLSTVRETMLGGLRERHKGNSDKSSGKNVPEEEKVLPFRQASSSKQTTKERHSATRPCGWSLTRMGYSPLSSSRRIQFCALLLLLLVLVLIEYCSLSKDGKILRKEIYHYWWNRFVASWTYRPPIPKAVLAGSISTRRQNLDYSNNNPSLEREMHLVERHLQLLERDMGKHSSSSITDLTVILLWSGKYPVWNANVSKGQPKNCNIPCEWTFDRKYTQKTNRNVTGIVCMLYQMEKGQCRDIDKEYATSLPILGVSWENDWRNDIISDVDELPFSQAEKMKGQSPYNLISSYELDSHIPILYPDLADFVDGFKIEASFEGLVSQHEKKKPPISFAISNCVAPIRPNRLELIRKLSLYYPTSSFGKCLGEEANYKLKWNSRKKYESSRSSRVRKAPVCVRTGQLLWYGLCVREDIPCPH